MSSSDLVLDFLLGLGEQVHAQLFAVPPPTPWSFGTFFDLVPGAVALAPEMHEWHGALGPILADSAFEVFRDEAGQRPIHVSTSLGLGWGMTIEMVPFAIMQSAAARAMVVRHSTSLSAFKDEIASSLKSFRRLLQGEAGAAIVVSGLDGLHFEEDVTLQLPWGRIRATDPHEARVAGSSGNHPTALMISEAPVRYQVGVSTVDSVYDAAFWDGYRDGLTRMALAFLLGASDQGAPGVVWTTTLLDGQSGSGSESRIGPRAHGGGVSLRSGDGPSIEASAATIQEHYSPAVGLAVNRTLRAIRERMSADDAIVDAVIALESLFTAQGQQEITFRVSTALARLLETDIAARRELQREVKRIYKVRSQIVHGVEVEPVQLDTARDAAITAACRTLRHLFTSRPELIADPSRGERILLED